MPGAPSLASLGVSTAPSPADMGTLRRGRWGRRAFFVAITGFLALGALGRYGVRTAEVTSAGGGYELSLRYAEVSRSGLATPWSLEIRRPGGFDAGTVTVATTSSYFDIFDENGVDPEPSESTSDGQRTIWTFTTPPGGDTLSVSFDARIEPAVQWQGADATTSVVGDGTDVASVSYRTFVMP